MASVRRNAKPRQDAPESSNWPDPFDPSLCLFTPPRYQLFLPCDDVHAEVLGPLEPYLPELSLLERN
jgi:hypothetical protein